MQDNRNDEALEVILSSVLEEFSKRDCTMKVMAADMGIPFSMMRSYVIRLIRRGWLEEAPGSSSTVRIYRAAPRPGTERPARRDDLVAAFFGTGNVEMTEDKYLVIGGLSL